MANESQISGQTAGQQTTQTTTSNEIITEQQKMSEDLPIIEKARAISETMQRVNEETKMLLDRREKMLAAEMIQGRAFAGLVEKKELSPIEYANEVLKGKINPLKV